MKGIGDNFHIKHKRVLMRSAKNKLSELSESAPISKEYPFLAHLSRRLKASL